MRWMGFLSEARKGAAATAEAAFGHSMIVGTKTLACSQPVVVTGWLMVARLAMESCHPNCPENHCSIHLIRCHSSRR